MFMKFHGDDRGWLLAAMCAVLLVTGVALFSLV